MPIFSPTQTKPRSPLLARLPLQLSSLWSSLSTAAGNVLTSMTSPRPKQQQLNALPDDLPTPAVLPPIPDLKNNEEEAAVTPVVAAPPPPLSAATLDVVVEERSDVASPSGTPNGKKKGPRPVEASLHVRTNLRSLQPKALAIAAHLAKIYPDPPIPLDHGSPFQLLCAVVLSAQTTDKKVNECTPELFRLAPDAAAMAALPVSDIEQCIRQLGLAPTKARNLNALAAVLVERHGGLVPDTFEELEALPGVGHKTASVVMAQVHGQEAFPVDTHIHRLAQRWGLTSGKSVEQTEADLKLLFPSEMWRNLHLQIIYFGREKCPAKNHDPAVCPICTWAAVHPYDKVGSSPLKPGQRKGKTSKAAGKRSRAAMGEGEEGVEVKRHSGAEMKASAEIGDTAE